MDVEKAVHGRPCTLLGKMATILQVTFAPLNNLELNYEVSGACLAMEVDKQSDRPLILMNNH